LFEVAQSAGQDGGAQAIDSGLQDRVGAIIELMRPTIQADGGDLELVEITSDGDVTVRFHGACVGCPSSTLTLKAGIERNLKAHVPGVRSVSAVES
jgi:Fe-S cluster biogenesis protein NfuA